MTDTDADTEINEEVIAAEAPVVASRLIAWFRQRLLIAETERDNAVGARESAEGDRRDANAGRDAAEQARVSAEDSRRAADASRKASDRRVVEVEALLVATEELAEQLQQALDSRVVIEQAKGMLAEQLAMTVDDAFDVLRGHARSNGRKLHDVAGDVVAGALKLSVAS